MLKTFNNQGARTDQLINGNDNKSQARAAKEAGFSERQTKQAVNIANIPENEFNEAVEGDENLSISKLALREF